MSLRFRIGRALLLVSCLSACQADLALPPGAQVACTTNAECPDGWQCRTTISRCVTIDSPDGEAPALVGTPEITPKALRSGTVTVTFVLDKPVAVPPSVRAEGDAGDPIETTAAARMDAERTWTATLAFGDAAIEQVYALRLALVGADGLEEFLSLGTVEIRRRAPAAPRVDRMVATFEPTDPFDAASPYQVRLRGTAGTLATSGQIRMYYGGVEGQVAPVAEADVDAELGFAEVVVVQPANAENEAPVSLEVVAVDAAGNTSDSSYIFEPPGLRQLVVRSTDSWLAEVGGAALRPGGRYRLGTKGPLGDERYLVRDVTGDRTIDLPPEPSEAIFEVPAQEGEGLVSLRLQRPLDGTTGFAPGSSLVTRARTFDVDGTPPVLATALVTTRTGFDGVVVRGAPGAVSDRIGGTTRTSPSSLCFAVLPMEPTAENVTFCDRGGHGPLVTPAPGLEIADDGSFGPAIAPAIPQGAGLYLLDPAGHAVKLQTLPESDGTPPTIEQLVAEPAVIRQGDPVHFRFISGDSQSDLPERPRVTFGGVAATHVSGALPAAGATTTFTYTAIVADPALLGPVEAIVSVIDSGAILRHARLEVEIDGASPVVTLEGASDSEPSMVVAGLVTDDTGVVAIEWSAARRDDGFGWNGTTFASGETWHRAETDGAFLLGPEVLPTQGIPLQFRVRATDRAGRTSSPVTRPLTLGGANPGHVKVRATTLGEQRVRVEWTPAPGADAASTRVSYRPEGSANWTGATAQQGPSPVTVTAGTNALELSGLTRGRWEFSVEAVRSGAPSARSPVVGAASPAWRQVEGPWEEKVIGVAGSDALLLAVTEATEESPSRIYRRVGDGDWDLVHTLPGATSVFDLQVASVMDLGFWYVVVHKLGDEARHESAYSTDGGLTWQDVLAPGGVPSFVKEGCRYPGDDRQVLTHHLDPATFSGAAPDAAWTSAQDVRLSSLGALACLTNGAVRHGVGGQLRSADRGHSFAFLPYETAEELPGRAVKVVGGANEHVLLTENSTLFRSTDGLVSYTSLGTVPAMVTLDATDAGAFVFSLDPGLPGTYVPRGGARIDRLDLRAPLHVLSRLRDGLVLLDTAQRTVLTCTGDCNTRSPFTSLPIGLPLGLNANMIGVRLSARESSLGLTFLFDGAVAVYGPLP